MFPKEQHQSKKYQLQNRSLYNVLHIHQEILVTRRTTRRKPMMPKCCTNNKPEIISRLKTRHQSLMLISPTAIACIIRVEACDPLLPPLEIIKGTNKPALHGFSYFILKISHGSSGKHFTKKQNNQPNNSFLKKFE